MLIANYLVSGKIEIKIRGRLNNDDRVVLAKLSQNLRLVKSGHWILYYPGQFSHIPLIDRTLKDYRRQIVLPMPEEE